MYVVFAFVFEDLNFDSVDRFLSLLCGYVFFVLFCICVWGFDRSVNRSFPWDFIFFFFARCVVFVHVRAYRSAHVIYFLLCVALLRENSTHNN